MTFFNKKEEVMEIQLTQYGKYLLSKGKFKPVYYSFSDDEVLYDPSYGVEEGEEALETQERIQNETVRIRPIYEHDGAETRVLKLNGHIIVDRPDETQGTRTGFSHQVPFDNIYGSDTIDSISMEPDDRHLMRNLLGTSQLGNQNIPSWSIKSLNEQEFEHPIHLSSSGPDIGINRPRITMNIDYNLYSHQLREGEMENLQDLELDYQTGIDNDVFF